MSVDVCYIASHGFASRMLTQTDLLGQLRRAGRSVAVIAPDAKDAVLSRYCSERGIELVEFDAKGSVFSDDYLIKRRYLLEDIRANPALWEKHLAATRYFKARNPFKRLRPHYYYALHRLIPRIPAIRERFLRKEERYLESRAAEELIGRLRPRRLVATYPVNLNEAILLHYGNRHPDVETWIHLLSWDNITCKGHFAETADQYIAWGPVMRDELREYYRVSEERIHVCGVPHFDQHVDPAVVAEKPRVLEALGLDPARPYFMFAMSSPRFAPHEIDIVEWLAERVSAGEFGDVQLLVRPHPQNVEGNMSDASWLPRLNAFRERPGVGVAFPKLVKSKLRWSMETADMIELAATLSGAAVVLNSGSTVSIDALMHDRPVVITSFDASYKLDYWQSARRLMDYRHLATLASFGGLSVVGDFASLQQALHRYLSDPAWMAQGRAESILRECLARDGGATGRVADVLASA